MRHSKRGFTLVEIMIVVAIIVLLAAIAIPNLMRARLNANEAAAIGACRTVSTAMESYRAAQTTPVYPPDLVTLATANPSYIDTQLGGGGPKSGYMFRLVAPGTYTYTLIAEPVLTNNTGIRSFTVDNSGVVRADGTPIGN